MHFGEGLSSPFPLSMKGEIMAAKKETAPEAVEEEVIVPTPRVEKMVTIRVPRDRDDKEDKVVWVNARRFLIQRGVPVTVPESVVDILAKEEQMLEYIYAYEEKMQNKAQK